MDCDQRDCVVRTVEPDRDGARECWAAGLRTGTFEERPVLPTRGFEQLGSALNAADLALKQVRESLAASCPRGCVCIPDLERKPTEGVYEVPVDLVASDTGGQHGLYVWVRGTIRVRLTEQPGKCWPDFPKAKGERILE